MGKKSPRSGPPLRKPRVSKCPPGTYNFKLSTTTVSPSPIKGSSKGDSVPGVFTTTNFVTPYNPACVLPARFPPTIAAPPPITSTAITTITTPPPFTYTPPGITFGNNEYQQIHNWAQIEGLSHQVSSLVVAHSSTESSSEGLGIITPSISTSTSASASTSSTDDSSSDSSTTHSSVIESDSDRGGSIRGRPRITKSSRTPKVESLSSTPSLDEVKNIQSNMLEALDRVQQLIAKSYQKPPPPPISKPQYVVPRAVPFTPYPSPAPAIMYESYPVYPVYHFPAGGYPR